MFYAEISKDGIEYRAFETERAAAEWIVGELGPDYADHYWIGDGGKLERSSACFDFNATVHASLEDAIVTAARCDPGAAVVVLRALCDAIERDDDLG